MKTRMGIIVVVGILIGAGNGWSQVARQSSGISISSESSEGNLITKIFPIQYHPIEELRNTITNLFGVESNHVSIDEHSSSIIILATTREMQSIEQLIKQLDVPDAKSLAVQNLMYRIFMFEIPTPDAKLKPFTLVLKTASQINADFFKTLNEDRLKISDFFQREEYQGGENSKTEYTIGIQGLAESKTGVMDICGKIPGAQIKEFKWDEGESFTQNLSAAQITQLPEPMQKYLHKFLGETIQPVAYWFGNSSAPGEVKAPLGPWTFEMNLQTDSEPSSNLHIEFSVNKNASPLLSQFDHDEDAEIIKNEIQARIGKPILIGYNRESFGTRKMGALVIIPEADMVPLEAAAKPTF